MKSSRPNPDAYEELGLHSTDEVIEAEEPELSRILGPDGKPIPYASKKLGFIGFIELKEDP